MGTRDWEDGLRALKRDHPHAYGDKQYIDWIKSSTGGSSPRVWGQVKLIDSFGSLDRIIPTRMGTSYYFVRIRTRF